MDDTRPIRTILLGNSDKVALVDAADYAKVSEHGWYLHTKVGARWQYAASRINGKIVLLHIFILGHRGIDHKDGNGLNCTRYNMRRATKSQNAANCGPHKDNTTGYRGVYFDKRDGQFYAQIMCQGKVYNLGRFQTAKEAHVVYVAKAKELFREFAYCA